MRKRLSFLLVLTELLLIHKSILAQNLVQNGSFEEVNSDFQFDHDYMTALGMIKYWEFSVNKGTPDYFHLKSRNRELRLSNKLGDQFPNNGNGYVGIAFHGKNGTFEYIQNELSQPLIAGKKYCLSAYMSLADNSAVGTDCFGAVLSEERIKSKRKYRKLKCEATVINPRGNFLTDQENWMNFCASFVAKGGEKYLTLGYFFEGEFTYIKVLKRSTVYPPYYYIDDVSLVAINDSAECICNQQTEKVIAEIDTEKVAPLEVETFEIEKGESIVLKDLYFETAKWEILEASFANLDKLAAYLKEYPDIKVEISGHTDNVGSEKDNQLLSENRAKAVVEYLTAKGIEPKRLSYRGYGSSQPVADNTTEEGRAQNRRVELKVVE